MSKGTYRLVVMALIWFFIIVFSSFVALYLSMLGYSGLSSMLMNVVMLVFFIGALLLFIMAIIPVLKGLKS